MNNNIKRDYFIIKIEFAIFCILFVISFGKEFISQLKENVSFVTSDGYVKWVDFDVSYEALCKAYELDVETYGKEVHLNWIELLAYVGALQGGKFDKSAVSEIEKTAGVLTSGEKTMAEITKDMKYYPYYLEVYSAVLEGYVGEYEIQLSGSSAVESSNLDSNVTENVEDTNTVEGIWEKRYGLKAFSPIARNFPYNDYDDFGVSRSYGYQRKHLGHDMMGQTGTPVIAVESGIVEALGWNQYGGWRIGIRSFDGKRYYYYAHLRQNYPFYRELAEGDIVTAGDVIGYMGHTGYSATENTNNIDVTHLHFGIQLIFDESQKEGDGEIWIDCYNLVRFLSRNRSEVQKEEGTKDWKRIYKMKDPWVEGSQQ